MIDQELELLKELKQKSPWTGEYQSKKEKFIWLLTELCNIHNMDVPKLVIPKYPNQFEWTKKYCGDCAFRYRHKGKIRIKNFSVITLLHEFKHWIDFHNSKLKWKTKKEKEKREYDAYYYSTRRFYAVWPERIKTLSEFVENNIFETKTAQLRMRQMKEKYQDTDVDYKLRAETRAIIDIVLGEVWC